MATESFTLVFDGSALEEGLMDARDLAHSLISLGAVVGRTNDIVNGERATVQLRIRAARQPGSFPAILELLQEVSQALIDTESPRVLLDYLGMTAMVSASEGAGVIENLIDLWKWLRGRKPEVIERNTEQNTATLSIDGDRNIVNQTVLNLYNDRTIKADFPRVLGPLHRQGVETLEIVHQGAIVRRLTKSDADAIAPATWTEDADVTDRTEDVIAELVTANFDRDYVWRFTNVQRGTFTARMRDEEFLERLDRREEVFGRGDSLRFRMRTRTVDTSDGRSQQERDIVRVLEVIHPPRQALLDI